MLNCVTDKYSLTVVVAMFQCTFCRRLDCHLNTEFSILCIRVCGSNMKIGNDNGTDEQSLPFMKLSEINNEQKEAEFH